MTEKKRKSIAEEDYEALYGEKSRKHGYCDDYDDDYDDDDEWDDDDSDCYCDD